MVHSLSLGTFDKRDSLKDDDWMYYHLQVSRHHHHHWIVYRVNKVGKQFQESNYRSRQRWWCKRWSRKVTLKWNSDSSFHSQCLERGIIFTIQHFDYIIRWLFPLTKLQWIKSWNEETVNSIISKQIVRFVKWKLKQLQLLKTRVFWISNKIKFRCRKLRSDRDKTHELLRKQLEQCFR